MPSEKVTAQLRYDFLMATFTELKTLAGSAVELSQAALQNENDPVRKKDLTTIHTLSHELLGRIADYLSLEPDRWTDELELWPRYDIWPPSAMIVGYAELLLEESFGSIDEAQRLALTQVREGGEAIHRVVAQLTDVFRIEKRRADINVGCLDEADLRETIRDFVSSSRKRGSAEVEAQDLEALPRVGIDYESSRALDSLAAALSRNFSQGKIVLTASCDGDTIAITLENAGFVLPAAALEESARVRSAATLFACRRFDEAFDLCIGQAIVEIHGGKLWVSSQAGGGSLVAFTLPVVKR
jgi:signal transduction histidine kinase